LRSYRNRIAATPLTSTMRHAPSQVRLDPKSDGVSAISIIKLNEIQAIRPEWLDTLIARLRPEKLEEVKRAQHFALGLRT
jgi:mRNA-degrading endonuclease toxin of MazEF toxin-antitoxin module